VWEEKRNVHRIFRDNPEKRNFLKHLGIDGGK
jgi:hypothetical protein